MLMRFLRLYVAYEAEGGAPGGGAPSGAPAGGAPGAVANLGAPAPAPAPSPAPAGGGDWKLPDGVPDHLKAANPLEFATKVFEDWGKQRAALSKVPAAPKAATEYQFQPSDKAKPFVGDLAKDPVFNLAKDVFFKAGVPPQMFNGVVGGLYDGLIDAGLLPKPYDPVGEARAFLGQEAAQMTPAQMSEKLTPLIDGAHGWINSLVSSKAVDQAAANQLLSLCDTAAGLKAVVALQGMAAKGGLNPGGAPAGATTTADGLRARLADPRNDPNGMGYEKAFAEETQRLYQQFYK